MFAKRMSWAVRAIIRKFRIARQEGNRQVRRALPPMGHPRTSEAPHPGLQLQRAPPGPEGPDLPHVADRQHQLHLPCEFLEIERLAGALTMTRLSHWWRLSGDDLDWKASKGLLYHR